MEIMENAVKSLNYTDINGNPDGGTSWGKGFTISWQRGPLIREGQDARNLSESDMAVNQNGAFAGDVIQACIDRLTHYQQGKFACRENELAIEHLQQAKHNIENRIKRRKKEGTLGKMEGA